MTEYSKTLKGRANLSKASRVYTQKLRLKAIEVLGGKCVKCGFSDIRALQIDHIHGGGSQEVKRLGTVSMLKKVINEPSGYQLLCANCNWIKRVENNEVKSGRNRIYLEAEVDPYHLRYKLQIDPETKSYTGRHINEKHGWAWEWIIDPETKEWHKYHFKLGHWDEGKVEYNWRL